VTASPGKPKHQSRFVSFTIIGEKLDPEKISAALKLAPSRAFRAGEKKGTGDDEWDHGLWSVSTESVIEAEDLAEHIAWLLDRLEPSATELGEVLSGDDIRARIFCFFETERLNDGIKLSAGIIKRLAALDLRVDIDIYNSSL
jgi:hypothetical protein